MDLPVLLLILIALGFLICLVGGIMLLVAAFRESVIWGLVVFFFMHLKYSPRRYWIWLGAAIFFVAHLVLGTGLDYLARVFLNLGNPGT